MGCPTYPPNSKHYSPCRWTLTLDWHHRTNFQNSDKKSNRFTNNYVLRTAVLVRLAVPLTAVTVSLQTLSLWIEATVYQLYQSFQGLQSTVTIVLMTIASFAVITNSSCSDKAQNISPFECPIVLVTLCLVRLLGADNSSYTVG